ncbi:hypothetical protein AV530_011649 [Patagioenas fasciata monilis]|uniref:Uncharacterized protein n=1 Tax=Patagioenas fasciata monilis TaxID=372326 RepID=A0A1V4J591_PATFA|nr:hypothetical protein AV530_011649 [Patagioenas fasciata monilis]
MQERGFTLVHCDRVPAKVTEYKGESNAIQFTGHLPPAVDFQAAWKGTGKYQRSGPTVYSLIHLAPAPALSHYQQWGLFSAVKSCTGRRDCICRPISGAISMQGTRILS